MKTPTVWVVSDTHFNHRRLPEFTTRPENFTELIINNWNTVVADDDLVLHLGDVILGRNSELGEINNKLKGKKVLVKGNHDNESLMWYMQRGFMFACDGFRWGEFWFTHEPAISLPTGCKYNVHGHLHADGHRINELGHPLRNWHILIEMESTLAPVTLDQVRSRAQKSLMVELNESTG